MDGWDFAIWSVAAYVAVLTLVRFMASRRKKMLDDLRQRAVSEQANRVTTAEAPGSAASK